MKKMYYRELGTEEWLEYDFTDECETVEDFGFETDKIYTYEYKVVEVDKVAANG